MILQKLDKYVFSGRYLFYIISGIIIIDCNLLNVNIVGNRFIGILFITCIGFFLAVIPRVFFLNYIKKFNRGVCLNYPFFFKLRYLFMNIPYVLKFMVYICIYIDRIFKLLGRFSIIKESYLLLCIVCIIYCFVMLFILFPIYMCILFLDGIYIYMEIMVKEKERAALIIKEFLLKRFHFFVMSVLFALLFGMSRVLFIIVIWVFDELLLLLYEGIKNIMRNKEGEYYIGNNFCYYLYKVINSSFCELPVYIGNMIFLSENIVAKRINVILFFHDVADIETVLNVDGFFGYCFDEGLGYNYNMLLIQVDCIFFNFPNSKYVYVLLKLFLFLDENKFKYAYLRKRKSVIMNLFLDDLEIANLQYYVDLKYVYIHVEKLFSVLISNKDLYKKLKLCYLKNDLFIENERKLLNERVLKLLKKLLV